jgi:ribosomal protein L11 methyltransferase
VYTDRSGEARLEAAFGEVVSTPVESGWEERWRAFHRPVRAGGLWIGPPWEPPPQHEVAVVIDPGRAFGTGAHQTTRACIDLLAAQGPCALLDAGCGSGVISVAAARLGFDPIVAVDLDSTAVEATRENGLRNGVRIDARRLDVLRDGLPAADLVVANIELAAVEALLARRPALSAITSGYLSHEVPAVPGWAVVDAMELDGWAAHVLVTS